MPRTTTKPILLLSSVGLVLALVVGLIGTAERGPARPRALPNIEPAGPYSPARSVLQTPDVLPPLVEHVDPPTAPETTPGHAAPPRSPSENPLSPSSHSDLARLVGFVLRPDGEPASRAQVVLGKQHARCDAQGRFEMAIAEDVAGADLLAYEPGSEPAVRPAFGSGLAGGGEFQIRLLLGPETLTLAGTVVDGEGRGLKGWTVELDGIDLLESFHLRERVRTDGEGRFELSDVSAGSHVVRAWKENPAAAVRSEPAASGEPGIRIVVQP